MIEPTSLCHDRSACLPLNCSWGKNGSERGRSRREVRTTWDDWQKKNGSGIIICIGESSTHPFWRKWSNSTSGSGERGWRQKSAPRKLSSVFLRHIEYSEIIVGLECLCRKYPEGDLSLSLCARVEKLVVLVVEFSDWADSPRGWFVGTAGRRQFPVKLRLTTWAVTWKGSLSADKLWLLFPWSECRSVSLF